MANEKRNVREWLSVISEASRGEHYPSLYKRMRTMLLLPSRRRKAVSLHKLNKYTKADDNVIVPRKILSTGKIDHKVRISALELSSGARTALQTAGCEIVDIKEMVKRDKIHILV